MDGETPIVRRLKIKEEKYEPNNTINCVKDLKNLHHLRFISKTLYSPDRNNCKITRISNHYKKDLRESMDKVLNLEKEWKTQKRRNSISPQKLIVKKESFISPIKKFNIENKQKSKLTEENTTKTIFSKTKTDNKPIENPYMNKKANFQKEASKIKAYREEYEAKKRIFRTESVVSKAKEKYNRTAK